MADRGDSEGFVLTPREDRGARPKDSYFPLSDTNTSELNGVVNCQNMRDNVVPRMQQWPLDIPK